MEEDFPQRIAGFLEAIATKVRSLTVDRVARLVKWVALFPLLLVVGFYIVLHGHLTPGGGFQGGVVLAAAFFIGVLARPSKGLDHAVISIIEGLAGAAFVSIGLWALFAEGAFLQPMLGQGTIGHLLSAGTLPLLSLALGLKVGSELAGLMTALSDTEAREP